MVFCVRIGTYTLACKPTIKEFNHVAQSAPQTQAQFLRKVYGVFYGALLVSVLSGAFCAQETIAPLVLGAWQFLFFLLFIGGFGIHFVRRTNGLNLVVFGIYAALWGAVLGPMLTLLNEVAPGVPLQAGILTVAVFGCLTLYVFQTGKDFQWLGGLLFVAILGLIISSLVMMFFNVPLLSTLYSFIGVLVFSGFILYDTSEIMHRLTPDEAITGSIELFVDFIGLFLHILNLLTSLKSRD